MSRRHHFLDSVHVHRSSERSYRGATSPGAGETAFQIVVGETDLRIIARSDLSADVAPFVHALRGRLQAYISLHPDFAASLTPLTVPNCAPDIIRKMAAAAEHCGVGPMAAVAGTVAQAVAEEFQSKSPDILVENGGDTFLISTKERVVGILPEPESKSLIGIAIPAGRTPLAICASSARIGHSLSLGKGDLAVAAAADGALADCAATMFCNMLTDASSVDHVEARAEELKKAGLCFVFAQCAGRIAVWGDLELVSV
jgi:hypothetical protein